MAEFDEEPLFEVEDVVDSRLVDGVVQYRVRWANFGADDDTWEPENNLLTCQDLIEKYVASKTPPVSSETSGSPAMPVLIKAEDHAHWNGEEENPAIFSNKSQILTLDSAKVNGQCLETSPTAKRKVKDEQKENDDDKDDESRVFPTPPRRKRKKREKRWEIAELKDKFWHNLEEGNVDLTLGLYERVKRKRRSAESAAGETKKRPVKKASTKKDEIESGDELQESCSSNSVPTPTDKLKQTFKQQQRTLDFSEIDEIVRTVVVKPIAHLQETKDKKLCSTLSDKLHSRSPESSPKKVPALSNEMKKKGTRKKQQNGNNPNNNVFERLDCLLNNIVKMKPTDEPPPELRPVSVPVDVGSESESCSLPQIKESSTTGEAVKEMDVQGSSVETIQGCDDSFSSIEDAQQLNCSEEVDGSSGNISKSIAEPKQMAVPVIPKPGRWLPLAPKLVVKDQSAKPPVQSSAIPLQQIVLEPITPTIEENQVEENGKEKVGAASSSAANVQSKDKSLTGKTAEKQVEVGSKVEKVSDQDGKKSGESIEESSSNFMKTVEAVMKKPKLDLPLPVDDELNVSEFFKADMQQYQADERLMTRRMAPTEFYSACRFGNFEEVRKTLIAAKNSKIPFNIDFPDPNGNTRNTPLMAATLHRCDCWHSSDDVLEILVQSGAHLNASNRDGDTALMLAIENEHLCKVTKLLSLGAAVNLPNRNGETPLMVACRKGFAVVAVRLLEYGANFNATMTNGRSVTELAVGSKQILKILQSHEAKVKAAFDSELQAIWDVVKMKLKYALFPMHCYALNESRTFRIMFNYTPVELPPRHYSVLIIGVGKFGSQTISMRFFGVSPILNISLNGVEQQPVQEDGRFVFLLTSLKSGANELLIKCADNNKLSQCKLLSCAYVVEIL